jgi:hypothetical protein
VIYEGTAKRVISGKHGTMIIVKNLFHNVGPSLCVFAVSDVCSPLGTGSTDVALRYITSNHPYILQANHGSSRSGKTGRVLDLMGGGA